MNSLPNTSFNYDPARISEMQAFLDHISTIARDNPGIYLNSDIVYRELCKWGIKKSDIGPDYQGKNIGPLFSMWSARFRNHRNIDVFCSPSWPYFCQFVHDLPTTSDGFIKLYVALDTEHVFEGANQIFDFIEKSGLKHQSKIGKQIRSDNVIIRLPINDVEGAKKVINYISSNPYLRQGMNRVNPFIPSINGVGYMTETGISYNSELSEQIADYLNILKSQGRFFGSVEEFRQYVSQNAYHSEVIDTLNKACVGGEKKVENEQTTDLPFEPDKSVNLAGENEQKDEI